MSDMREDRDWGVKFIAQYEPDDTSWVDHPRYPDTSAYRLDYQKLNELIAQRGGTIRRYLSLGSGLGRHIIIAKEFFPDLESVVAVDDETRLHSSVFGLGLNIEELPVRIETALKQLQQRGEVFDMVAFENVPNHGLYGGAEAKEAIGIFTSILALGGVIVFIGDSSFPRWEVDESKLFDSLPAPLQGFWTTIHCGWIRKP